MFGVESGDVFEDIYNEISIPGMVDDGLGYSFYLSAIGAGNIKTSIYLFYQNKTYKILFLNY